MKKDLHRAFLDIETTTAKSDYYLKNNETTIIIGDIKIFEKEKHFFFINCETLFTHLENYVIDNNCNLDIWIHNLKFDTSYFLNYLLCSKLYKYFPDGMCRKYKMYKGAKWTIFMTADPRKVYSLTLTIANCKITFKDSMNFYGSSLDKVGKDFGMIKKTNIIGSYDEYNPCNSVAEVKEKYPKYVEYLKQDVDILEHIVISAIDEGMIKDKLTSGATAWSNSQLHWKKKGKKLKDFKENFCGLTKDEFYEARKYVGGGYTNYSPLYHNKWINSNDKQIIYDDINSAYPNEASKPIPVGKVYSKLEHQIHLRRTVNYQFTTWYEILIIKGKMKNKKYPAIIPSIKTTRDFGSFLTEIKNKVIYVNEKEFMYYKKFYHLQYHILKTQYQQLKTTAIKDFMYSNWKEKQRYSKEKKIVKKTSKKLNINGWIGKTAQDMGKSTTKFAICEKNNCKMFDYKNHIKFGDDKNTWHFESVKAVKTTDTKEKENWRNAWTNAFITMNERCRLYQEIITRPPNWFIYCDTDSIVHFESKYDMEIGEGLGEWEREMYVSEFKVIKQKTYVIVSAKFSKEGKYVGTREKPFKVACVGFSKAKSVITYNNFNIGEKFPLANLKTKFTKYGIILVDMDYEITFI